MWLNPYFFVGIGRIIRFLEDSRSSPKIETKSPQISGCRCGGQRVNLGVGVARLARSLYSERWETGSTRGSGSSGNDGGLSRRNEGELTQHIVWYRRGHGGRQRVLSVYSWLVPC